MMWTEFFWPALCFPGPRVKGRALPPSKIDTKNLIILWEPPFFAEHQCLMYPISCRILYVLYILYIEYYTSIPDVWYCFDLVGFCNFVRNETQSHWEMLFVCQDQHTHSNLLVFCWLDPHARGKTATSSLFVLDAPNGDIVLHLRGHQL